MRQASPIRAVPNMKTQSAPRCGKSSSMACASKARTHSIVAGIFTSGLSVYHFTEIRLHQPSPAAWLIAACVGLRTCLFQVGSFAFG